MHVSLLPEAIVHSHSKDFALYLRKKSVMERNSWNLISRLLVTLDIWIDLSGKGRSW